MVVLLWLYISYCKCAILFALVYPSSVLLLKPLEGCATGMRSSLGSLIYRIRPNYRIYPYKRTVNQFHSLQITACVLLSASL